MIQRLIPLLLGLTAFPAVAGEVTVQEISRVEAETLLYEYANCNDLEVRLSPALADVTATLSGRRPSERDRAVEVALSCQKEWADLVEELAFTRGYEEALRIGLEVQGRMISRNVASLRTLPQ